MGTNSEAKKYLESVLTLSSAQMVIDADAINIIAEHPKLKEILQKTPLLHHILKNLKDWLDHGKPNKKS